MKLVSLIALLSLSFTTIAHDGHDHDHDDKQSFDQVKEKVLKGVDQRLAQLQEHKACVSAAKDKDGLKACHMKMKEKRKEFRREKKKD